MTFLLYGATAISILWLVRGRVLRFSRGAAIVLFLLPLVVTGKALLTGSVFGPVDLPYVTQPLSGMRLALGVPVPHNGSLSDIYAQVFPWRKSIQDALQRGEWPIWNPYMLSGDILAAAGQPGAFFPFTLIACVLPAAVSLTYTAAIAFFLAGLGAFLFARELGLRDSVALLAAAGWMYATPMAFFVLWSFGSVWPFLPWVFLGTRRCVRAPSLRSAVILCASLALLVLAGHPESALHIVSVGCAYGLVELLRVRRNVVRVLGTAAAAGIVALALCAIYLLPQLEATRQTAEYETRKYLYANEPRGEAMPQVAARVATDVFAVFYGERWNFGNVRHIPLDTSSAGSILLVLAVCAVIRTRRPETWFFAALAVFGILARAGVKAIHEPLRHLPLFDIALNERYSFAAAFAIVMLAAFAIEEFLERRTLAVPLIVTAGLIVITIGSLLPVRMGWSSGELPDWGWYRVFGEVGCLALAALILTLHLPRRAMVLALLAVLLVQRWCEVGDVYPTLPATAAYPPIPLFNVMKNVREPFRVAGHFMSFTPNMSAYYGLEDVRGYEAMTFSRYVDTYRLWSRPQPIFFNRVDYLDKPFLSFLNVRFAIGDKGTTVPPGWHVVAAQRDARLFENERVIPRAFVPRHVTANEADGDALNEMSDATDFTERAWIKLTGMKPQEFANGRGTVSLRRNGFGFDIDAAMESNGWVVLSEPAWRGWRIYVDGQRENWYFANQAFLGIWVPAGRHHVRVMYLPASFVTGRAITFGTLAALLAGTVVLAFRRRRTEL